MYDCELMAYSAVHIVIICELMAYCYHVNYLHPVIIELMLYY